MGPLMGEAAFRCLNPSVAGGDVFYPRTFLRGFLPETRRLIRCAESTAGGFTGRTSAALTALTKIDSCDTEGVWTGRSTILGGWTGGELHVSTSTEHAEQVRTVDDGTSSLLTHYKTSLCVHGDLDSKIPPLNQCLRDYITQLYNQ